MGTCITTQTIGIRIVAKMIQLETDYVGVTCEINIHSTMRMTRIESSLAALSVAGRIEALEPRPTFVLGAARHDRCRGHLPRLLNKDPRWQFAPRLPPALRARCAQLAGNLLAPAAVDTHRLTHVVLLPQVGRTRGCYQHPPGFYLSTIQVYGRISEVVRPDARLIGYAA